MITQHIRGSRGLRSRATLLRLCLLPSLALWLLANSACARSDSGSNAQEQPLGGATGSLPGTAPEAAMPEAASGGERAPEAKPLAPRGAAATVAAKPQTAQAAASLGGHDRFLVFGEGHPVLPADFLIGALAASDGDARLKPFSLLRASLAKGELDSQAFAENSARISSLVFGKALSKAKPIRELRLGAPQTVAGGAAFRFRLLGDELSALGEAILQNESGGWRIEHFELDREALALPRQKPEGWEPPLALYP